MQTFLPYGSEFEANAYVLDIKRLGKQRVEGLQILNANDKWRRGVKAGWQNHPASVMWRTYDAALIMYTLTMCERWVELGYSDTVADRLHTLYPASCDFIDTYPDAVAMPPWIDDPQLCYTHKCNLVRKHPEHYLRFWPLIPAEPVAYYWPIERKVSQ
jgi:hypothetical protein